MFDLTNKNIIVTGAAGLMGSQFCEAILEFNGTPLLLDIDYKKLEILSNKFQKRFKKKIFYYKLDITDENEIIHLSKVIKKNHKSIYSLINNAAYNPDFSNKNFKNNNKLETFDLHQWNKEIEVGLTGSFLCSKHYGKIISKNKNGGVIINISSDLGLISPYQDLYKYKNNKKSFKPITYSVVKSGMIGLTKYLSTYWAKQNVRCNVICPGGIKTNQSKLFLNKIHKLIPLNRMAKKNEYKSTIIWILSENSEYLNGAVISIDGGRTAW